MVQTYERPAEEVETPDRSFGRSFYLDSATFLMVHNEILQEKTGVIAQVEDGTDLNTIIFDARQADTHYIWQRTQVTKATPANGRTVTQIGVNSTGEIWGWEAKYNSQGSLLSVFDLAEHEIKSEKQKIKSLAHSSAAQLQREKLYSTRAAIQKDLDELSWLPSKKQAPDRVFIVSDADYVGKEEDIERDDKGNIIVRQKKVFSDDEILQEIQMREASINKIGFTALTSSQKPSFPVIDY